MILAQTALLVIDMQKGSFTPATPRYNTEGVVDKINTIAATLRAKGRPILYIQHDGSQQNNFLPGSSDWEILDGLEVEEVDLRVSKTANDCFYESPLAQQLKDTASTHLLITGCATDFCVAATVQSALAKNYRLTVISDAHTTADRPHLPAEKIIVHYNWVWQNMLPTKGSLKVMSASDLFG